jgi:hypothetical protein
LGAAKVSLADDRPSWELEAKDLEVERSIHEAEAEQLSRRLDVLATNDAEAALRQAREEAAWNRARDRVLDDQDEAARQNSHPAWQADDRARAAGGVCWHCELDPRRGPHGLCPACNMTRRRTGHLPTAAAIDRRRDRQAGYR